MIPFRIRRIAAAVLAPLRDSLRDLLPIILVVAFFQLVIFRKPLANVEELLFGLCLVLVGLALFIAGLKMALFPLGEGMADDFAQKGSVPWLVVFACALGFGTAFAEPALIAIAEKAAALKYADLADEGTAALRASFALALRTTVAGSAGLALAVGVFRIVKGWPIQYFIIGGYALVIAVTPFAPSHIVAIAYDSGGVTTSTITVPLTAALGVGLASRIRGRSPLIDGFGLIALAALAPILFVLGLGIVWQ